MSNIKYTLDKHKPKIILGVSIVLLLSIVGGIFFYVSKDKDIKVPEEVVYEDKDNKLAEYMFLGNENGDIDLLKVSDTSISNSINIGNGKTIYAKDNSLEKIMAFNNGIFYELSDSNGLIDKKEIIKTEHKEIKSFKFSEDYIVAFTNNDMITISIKDKKESKITLKEVEAYVVNKSTLVYSKDNNIILLNLTNKEEKLIDVGEKTDALFITNNDYVIAFNKFGKGIGKYSLLQLKSNDLYIEKAYSHDNSTVIPVSPDSDDTMISFVDTVEKNSLKMQSIYRLDLVSEKNNKKRIAIQTSEDSDGSEFKKSISTKGYMYTNINGSIEVFDFRGESIKFTIQTDKTFFMPILK